MPLTAWCVCVKWLTVCICTQANCSALAGVQEPTGNAAVYLRCERAGFSINNSDPFRFTLNLHITMKIEREGKKQKELKEADMRQQQARTAGNAGMKMTDCPHRDDLAEKIKGWSSYCKLICTNTSQKSPIVVVSGLHKSFIMRHLRSAFKKCEGKKKNHTHSQTHTLHMIHTSSLLGDWMGIEKFQ